MPAPAEAPPADPVPGAPTVAVRALLGGLVLLPPLYVSAMIAYGAILVPFADGWATAEVVLAQAERSLTWGQLVALHNEHRPLTARLLWVGLAALTRWDLRVEYVAQVAALLGLLAVLGLGLWRATGRRTDHGFLLALGVLSLVLFSPAQHNNHWWSWMLCLNLGAGLAAGALLAGSAEPTPRSQVLATVLSWLAAYTVANGLPVVAVAGLLAQLPPAWPPRRLRLALWWGAQAAALAALYLPGLPPTRGHAWSDLPALAAYALAYLGAPLANLAWFQFPSMFETPAAAPLVDGIVGALVVAAAGVLVWRLGPRVIRTEPGGRLAAGCLLFGLAGAALTAWGRLGLESPGVSRYVAFGNFFTVGVLLLVVRWHRGVSGAGSPGASRALVGGALTLLAAGAVSYARAVPVYGQAREFNRTMAMAFNRTPEFDYVEQWLYPAPERIRPLKERLRAHRLGPYRTAPAGGAPGWSVPPVPVLPPGEATPPGAGLPGEVARVLVGTDEGGRYLDVAGWAAAAPADPPDTFVVVDVDQGAARTMAPVGIPVLGFYVFGGARPDLPRHGGWGVRWRPRLDPGPHVVRAYRFQAGAAGVRALAGGGSFTW
jgi:hypothetical protein